MPELPDVEAFRRYLDATALRQRITRVDVAASRILTGISARALGRTLVHHRFVSTLRHGKHLFARLDRGPWLMLHFGMTGSLSYYKEDMEHHERPRYIQVRIDFDNGHHLAYADPRKLGRIALTDRPSEFIESHRLGPDALALDSARFRELVAASRGAIKPWLMNQQIIAGIGNIYADEILFQARIHPQQSTDTLDKGALTRLFRALRRVLEKAIAAQADPVRMPRTFLLPRRQRGARCPRCDRTLKTMASGGRTTYFCPGCQRLQ